MMAGASRDHNRAVGNAFTRLSNQLRNRDCEVFSSDMRVEIFPMTHYTYPDIVGVCGEQQYDDETQTLANPMLIIEVSSPSTVNYDRDEKFIRYQRITSLHEYVLIAQAIPRLESYVRQPNVTWIYTLIEGLEGQIELASIGCTLSLADVYRNVKFETRDQNEA